jgi:hypothetical protein
MPNKRYIAGRNFEYKIKRELENMGWYVIRSAGSKSLFDLTGIKIEKINEETNLWEYPIWVGFWQLKKNISDEQALKILDDIINALFGTNLLGHLQFYSSEDFNELSRVYYIWDNYEEEDSQQYIAISFGVIYTTPKLTKGKMRYNQRKQTIKEVK